MSGGEPSSIKRNALCDTVRSFIRTPGCTCGVSVFCFFAEWEGTRSVSGSVSKMAAAAVCRRGRSAAGHSHAPKRAEIRPNRARIPVHRLARHRQNHLRQNSGQSGQLPAPRGRRPVRRMRNLPRDRQRRRHRRHRDRRRQQQRRGQHPRPARGSPVHPRRGQIPRVYHRRGAYAVARRVQCAAENARRTARARRVHPGDHGGA